MTDLEYWRTVANGIAFVIALGFCVVLPVAVLGIYQTVRDFLRK